MGVKKGKKKSSKESVLQKKPVKTILKRKQLRKDKRQAKKTSKKDFYKKKFVIGRTHDDDEEIPSDDEDVGGKVEAKKPPVKDPAKVEAEAAKKEKQLKEQKRQEAKQRRRQLKLAQEEEMENISKLEKQLGLKKRKSKNLPKSFSEDGLDYLLNVCDSSKIEALGDDLSDEEDENEFVKKMKLAEADSDDSDQEGSGVEGDSDEEMDDMIERALMSDQEEEEEVGQNADDNSGEESEEMEGDEVEGDEVEEGENEEVEEGKEDLDQGDEDESGGVWEDIYGRTRSKDGAILKPEDKVKEDDQDKEQEEEEGKEAPATKYIPPAMRRRAELGPTAEKKVELARLAKQLKGQLNRLAESNMPGIAKFVEGSYRQHARNDVNEALTSLLHSALVLPSLTPARLVMEHVMLVALLHANVGTEVGAHILQSTVRAFATSYSSPASQVAKETQNLLLVISYLYSFKVVNCGLVFDILGLLVDSFQLQDIELTLVALRNCGFALRKDDPAALKTLILKIQAKAAASQDQDSRLQFMLEVLMAIKNNNMAKIPNYDPSHFEHLKKTLRSLVREGNSVTELRITYKDLVAAETAGRWWIVGSAFTGSLAGAEGEARGGQDGQHQYSNQLVELARKMRMNTETRRNIFCLLMSAEDYLDATERLVKLGTRNQLEREVMFVVTDCCVQEKVFNPYYCHLASQLATVDRRYRVAGQFTVWDKLRQAGSLQKWQLGNLARYTAFLVQQKVQSLGILKVIEFAEMNKTNVRFLRAVLLPLLLEGRKEEVVAIFQAVASPPALAQFRESVRLFLHHFLLRPQAKLDPKVDRKLLSERAHAAEAALLSASTKLRL